MNENFVTFEVSKKLKEKGFPLVDYIPTISQVLKWLREEKNIFVLIDIRTDLSFFYEIWCIEIALHPMGCVPFQKYQSYEQSALAGIEYVIDNLI